MYVKLGLHEKTSFDYREGDTDLTNKIVQH